MTIVDWQVRIINGKKQFQDLVGAFNMINEKEVSIESWNKEYNELLIVIDGNMNGRYKSEEKISMAFGEESFFNRLRDTYGINAILMQSFSWSETTNDTVRVLRNSGFKSLIMRNGEFFISDDKGSEMKANFLSDDERNFINENNKVGRTYNQEKIIDLKDIYLK